MPWPTSFGFAAPVVFLLSLVLSLSHSLAPVNAAPSPFGPTAVKLVRHEWHEPRHVQGWQQRGRLAGNATLPMRIGFSQHADTVNRAHDLLMDRSDPTSLHYGKHLTAAAVADLFAPATDAVDKVRAWVVGAGISPDRISMSANRQASTLRRLWLQFVAEVDEVERLLRAVYYSYEHTESGIRLAACPEYNVPENLQRHIDYITPGVKLASYGFDVRAASALQRQRKQSTKRQGDTATGAESNVRPQTSPLRPTPQTATPAHQTALADPPWVLGGCDQYATFACIKAQYGLPLPLNESPNSTGGTAGPVPGNELGIFQSLGMHYSQQDLDIYFSYTAPQMPTGTGPELRAINGAYGPYEEQATAVHASNPSAATPGLEANLDLQIAMPLVYPQKTVLWQVDDEWYETNSTNQYPGFFNTLFDAIDGSYCTSSAFGETGNCVAPACRDPVYPNPHAGTGTYSGPLMCGAFQPTNVIAISYSNVEHALPAPYLQRQCLEILKLGLQGTTVVESSGDNGVGGATGRSANPYIGCLGANRTVFSPRSLSDCPYVLSVGATVLTKAGQPESSRKRRSNVSARAAPFEAAPFEAAPFETAPTFFASGGGFSNIFATPDWQQAAVDAYLDHANLGFSSYGAAASRPGLFNRSGRAYPDVAAVGDNIMIMHRGSVTKVAGTSVAVPIWAAVLTLVNEARLLANKTPVGFVNPVLYQHPDVFTDITEGSNPGCGSSGFPATRGWDPVTGLGTPVFPKLRDLFLSLP